MSFFCIVKQNPIQLSGRYFDTISISLANLSAGLSDYAEKYRLKVSEMSDIIKNLETEITSQKERYDSERKRNDECETLLLDKLGEAPKQGFWSKLFK